MSAGVDLLLWQISLTSIIPPPLTEHKFHHTRDWRFDLAWPDHHLAVECDGAVFANGRHTRGAGFTEDCEKCNAAALAGWTVLRFTTEHVETGYALAMIEAYFRKLTLLPYLDPTPPPRSQRRRY